MAFSSPRTTETTLPCDACGNTLLAERDCRKVILRCSVCGARYEVRAYASRMDAALERFLENLYCDRI